MPFGVSGALDMPDPTPTPIAGSITVYVLNRTAAGPTPVPGVDVVTVDPLGNTAAGTTNTFGLVILGSPDIVPGIWTVTVPSQGIYFNSSQSVTMAAGSSTQSVTFTSGEQSLSVSGPATAVYSPYGSVIQYQYQYTQPHNLKVPVDFTTSGSIPACWDVDFSPVSITDSGSGLLSVNVPLGGVHKPQFHFFGIDAIGNTVVTTSSVGGGYFITRYYPINTTVQFIIDSKAPNYYAGHLRLTTDNPGDVQGPWSATVVARLEGVAGDWVSQSCPSSNFVVNGVIAPFCYESSPDAASYGPTSAPITLSANQNFPLTLQVAGSYNSGAHYTRLRLSLSSCESIGTLYGEGRFNHTAGPGTVITLINSNY